MEIGVLASSVGQAEPWMAGRRDRELATHIPASASTAEISVLARTRSASVNVG